jgi:predicted ATP-grasp superfamily ATP-dependent carboligase
VDNSKSILILEVHAKASLPIIESCKSMGLRVVVGSHKRHCCGMYSKVVDEKVIYPNVIENTQNCLDFLLQYIQNNSIEAVFPVGDVMTDLVARNQSEFKKFTNILLPSYEIFIQGRNKVLTLKAAQRAGCPIPVTWFLDGDLSGTVQEIRTYPVLIKPALSAGARGITFCNNKKELLTRFQKTEEQYGQSYIQDYVPQTGLQYKVDAVMDNEQRLYAGVVYSKIRYYPPSGGSSVLNRTVHRPDILDLAVKVMRELKWIGFCDFDFITDPRDNVIKLMEINPRFPESYKATIAAGVDMTKIIYQLAIGQKALPQLEYQTDQYIRFLFGDIMWFLTTEENRWKAKPNFFKFCGKDIYYQLLKANDLGPLIGYIMENISMLWDSKFRRERLR